LPLLDELGGVLRVSLLPVFSRPLQLRRILLMVCQLGPNRIVLSNAQKLLREYFRSSLLHKPETLQGLLVEELTISSNVSLPDVGRSWRTSWTDESGDDVWGGRGGSDKWQATSTRMPDMVFPNDGDGGGLRMMLVTIGPESGWEEPHELDMFKRLGFQRVLLGLSVLRSDVRS